MRVPMVVLFLGSAWLLSANLASGQPRTGVLEKPMLVGRIEVDQHEHCFAVRLFIKNVTDRDIKVTYGRGDKGLEVVPFFNFGSDHDIHISPPIYIHRPKQGLSQDALFKQNVMPIPAGKEVLYGTFTMGYPASEKERVDDLFTTLNLWEPQSIVEATPVRLKIPAQKSGAAAAGVTTEPKPQAPDSPGEWVHSDNGALSLRLRAKSNHIATQDSIVVVAAIRNNRSGPVTILRPFGDPYFATAVQIRIWGERGQVKYTGPKWDYDLNAKAFVTLGPNEIVSDTLELPVSHFAGTDKAGSYTLRYDYAYSGTWDKKVASEGIRGIWRGTMCSREIHITKQEAAAKVPGEKLNQTQLNAELRKLLVLNKALDEKPDDPTAQQDAAAQAVRLAPHLPGNRTVLQILLKTRTLKDGISLAAVEKLIGPPTQRSEKSAGWYFNPLGFHIAPYLQAKVTKDGLVEWRLSER